MNPPFASSCDGITTAAATRSSRFHVQQETARAAPASPMGSDSMRCAALMPTAYTRVSCGSVSKWQSRSNRINECCSAKNVEITIPDEFAGSIVDDLNARRGRIQGMDNKAGNTL
jgi:hypothetical protein